MISIPHLGRSETRYFHLILVVLVSVLAAQPAMATPAREGSQQSELTGAVYDGAGLPLFGALIAVAVPGSESPMAMAISDTRGRFSFTGLAPGVYTLMARSFGFVSAVLPEVAIPSLAPVQLQLRSERQVVSLLSDGAALDLGWAFRPRVRDILRQTEATGLPPNGAPTWLGSLDDDASIWDRIGGELNLWAVAPGSGRAAEDGRTATDVSLGSFSGEQNWILRGQVADGGVVRAHSEISRLMSDSHTLRLGVGFAGKDLTIPGINDDRRRMWVGSVAAEDYWRFNDALQVGWGVRFEHYNYLEEAAVISPRVQVAFVPIESVRLTTGVSYDAEAPGLAELRFQVDPLAVRYMDVLTPDGIDPERTLRLDIGVQRSTRTTDLRARAYHDQVQDELIGIYLANPSGSTDYVVTNIGDAVTQGFEFDVRQTLANSVSGLFSYAYGRRDGADLPANVAVERGFVSGDVGLNLAAVDIVHELAASIETIVGYDTRLQATYRWQRGVPVVRDGNMHNVYERLDLRVRQPLPFGALASEWSALVQVQNVLGYSYDSIFDLGIGDAPVLSRLVTGGLAVRF